MNQHLGMQAQELFGIDNDADGDGIANELTVGDLTAISFFQFLKTLQVVTADSPQVAHERSSGK